MPRESDADTTMTVKMDSNYPFVLRVEKVRACIPEQGRMKRWAVHRMRAKEKPAAKGLGGMSPVFEGRTKYVRGWKENIHGTKIVFQK